MTIRKSLDDAEKVKAILQANPQAAAEKDVDGRLPLHWVAEQAAPVEVVKVLLEANPQAAAEKDRFGCLPLHLAAEAGAPEEVARVLLEAHPQAATEKDNDGCLPHHWVVKPMRDCATPATGFLASPGGSMTIEKELQFSNEM